MTDVKTTLAAEVRRCRKRAGLSQEELAERIGITREAISQIERGKTKRPTDDVLIGFEQTLGLSRTYAYHLMGAVPGSNDVEPSVLLQQIAALPDHEARMEAWDTLPENLRLALYQHADDIALALRQQAQAGIEQMLRRRG
jgi:transcriptional regulator with XRE-family HTH domain